jgi:hypothetical protein
MPECINCGRHASRRRRGFILKLISRASFRCEHCGAKFNFYRPVLTVFERYAQCPLCANRELSVRQSVDQVDRMSGNLLRRLLIGCPLYHCTYCRYQFRDWRGLDPNHVIRFKSASANHAG